MNVTATPDHTTVTAGTGRQQDIITMTIRFILPGTGTLSREGDLSTGSFKGGNLVQCPLITDIVQFSNSRDADEAANTNPPQLDLHCLPSSL